MLERVTRRIEAELRRRLGGAFTAEELAELYERGTDWTTDLAVAAAPDEPFAWDARVVGDAAFARYLRSAADFAGGRRAFRHARSSCRRPSPRGPRGACRSVVVVSPPPARRITIWSSSIVTSTGRWPAQCSA